MNMTDKERFPDGLLDRGADDQPHAHRNDGRRWTSVLVHRWPTALGVAVAALTVFDLRGGTELAALTMLMPGGYLGAAALDRGRVAWGDRERTRLKSRHAQISYSVFFFEKKKNKYII